ncbi:hypothetical protein MTBBW1_1460001 [Desulfamplus magnetovallimortis]|uniref:Uncharacterized protein n=1 Tax=Desulfamplus magnetovallimortis TaxID=1246637 RepID=A0A1W1H8H3_9BACT|nr:hypothetical protein MTBBW1_1460001 [Desulfamplus magnetovallimortis]
MEDMTDSCKEINSKEFDQNMSDIGPLIFLLNAVIDGNSTLIRRRQIGIP